MTEKSHHSRRVTRDSQGRPYACLSSCVVGMELVPDGGFDCMDEGQPLVVQKDEHGLYIECTGEDIECTYNHGIDTHHYLSGQADDGEHLIGLYRKEDY